MAGWILGVFNVRNEAESETASGLLSGNDRRPARRVTQDASPDDAEGSASEPQLGENASDFNKDEY
jgi:hypothetical protein